MDFNSILETNMADVTRPPLLPKGPYTWSVGQYKQEERGADNQLTILEFPAKLIEADDTVDQDALSEYGTYVGVVKRVSFIFNNGDDEEAAANNQKTLFRVKQFLGEHCLIPDYEDKSLKELLAESQGCTFVGFIDWRQDKDNKEIFYDEIRRTLPLAD
jgi:hypothetical protein